MSSNALVSGTSALAAAAVAWIAWMQLSRDNESRHASRTAARRAAALIILRLNRAIEELLGYGSSLNRAHLYVAAMRAEIERAYLELVSVTASLSERDAMAVIRAGTHLQAAGVILAGYAADAGPNGPFDRLHLAKDDLQKAYEELDTLLEPCVRAHREELRARLGLVDEIAQVAGQRQARASEDP